MPDCIEVRKSKIHGNGVFATEDIPRGRIIIEYKGKRCTPEEIKAYIKEGNWDPYSGHTFLFSLDDGSVLDGGRKPNNEARFINHSCSPNVLAKEEDGRIWIAAAQPIKKGKELFLDYALDASTKKPSKRMIEAYACHCKSPKCRGTMLDI